MFKENIIKEMFEGLCDSEWSSLQLVTLCHTQSTEEVQISNPGLVSVDLGLVLFYFLFKVNQKPSTVQLNPDTMELYVLCHRSQDGLIKFAPKSLSS